MSPPSLLVHMTGEACTGNGMIAGADGRLVPSREIGDRMRVIVDGLAKHPHVHVAREQLPGPGAGDALATVLPRVHRPDYLQALQTGAHPKDPCLTPLGQQFSAPGVDQDTPLDAGSFTRAEAAARTSVQAALTLVQGRAMHGYALCRPPGHHAGRRFFGGYCYLNNAAIAAVFLDSAGLGPVSVIDLDYHVGNGTSDCLATHPGIAFASCHASPCGAFPYVPDLSPAHPAHRYIAFDRPPGVPEFLGALDCCVSDARARASRSLVVSIGFDIIEDDPHGGWFLPPFIFREIGVRLAATGLPVCFVQEGGYRIDALSNCASALAEGLLIPAAT